MSDKPSADSEADPGPKVRTVPLARGLSTKLLLLTIVFVLMAEIFFFLPAIGTFRLNWLKERLNTAGAVSIVLVQGDPASLSRAAQDDVLMAIGAKAIAVRDGGISRLLVVAAMPPRVDEHVDVANLGRFGQIAGALDTLVFGGDRMLRVYGPVGDSDKEFELIMPDSRLRTAMLAYSRNIALVSLLISLFSAVLVYATIDRIMIRPIRTMTRSMLVFSDAPDDPVRIIRPSDRADEIGIAERELSQMQERLQRMLAEQKHLADLGLAVSKINHDMRNILASAQLISDRLQQVKDPTVQAFAPKLLRTLDRAVAYSEGVLAYGRTQEAAPARRLLRLRQLVEDVHGLLVIEEGIEFVNAVEPDFEVDADADQLFRVLTNLSRNAVQAMAGDTESAVVRRLTISAERTGSVSRILVIDTGPGLPPKARENLFAAFRGSARSGGTGLGLAIAQELIRAHGGTVELVESVGGRTVFSVTIPDQPVRLDQARSHLRRPA
ncbi:HAMP domain-containing sensor histidine kinase [Mesorhizobium sp. SP-1A]|uniref:HAMP domain-containing sensor histidine kinase n=1 Tax=Mesorhizobium sp. SP-1A TaxID=3077840 RepID=UPI0028F6E972|nr:HAMP domain-containing sensor histidine kinase [Mesorhizobium sp. SP-1A]